MDNKDLSVTGLEISPVDRFSELLVKEPDLNVAQPTQVWISSTDNQHRLLNKVWMRLTLPTQRFTE